ncbi:hypothetical protein HER11_04820 [Fervidobacterium pennivorans subsp. keratinolyticus]|nr:hypothetical protein HER11_04820 [Fervidobacterium pennivorans subsp. keratinolyticus]
MRSSFLLLNCNLSGNVTGISCQHFTKTAVKIATRIAAKKSCFVRESFSIVGHAFSPLDFLAQSL